MQEKMRSFNLDFSDTVAKYGDRTIFIASNANGRSFTYEEIDGLVDRNLKWLEGLGIVSGARIGALLPNSIEMLVLFLSCLRGGYGFAPLAVDSTKPETANWSRLLRPWLCIHDESAPRGILEGLDETGAQKIPISIDGRFSFLSDEKSSRRMPGSLLFFYTSGTTGAPKAIVINGDTLWSSGHAFARNHGFDFNRRFCIWNYLPHSYIAGLYNMALIPMSVGGTVIVDDAFGAKTFLGFWQTVKRFRINVLWFIPTIVRGILALDDKGGEPCGYGTLVDKAFIGTAPIDLSTKRGFEKRYGIPLMENFALSETLFITSEFDGEDEFRQEGSVGRCLPEVKIRLIPVDDDGNDGLFEILVDSPYLAEGYLGLDGRIKLDLQDGFFPTGDLGYLDSNGRLVLTGRRREIIKKGGYLVALREIEVLALSHPGVVETAAVAITHPFYGESYNLWIKLKTGEPVMRLTEIRSYIFNSLARHKWPQDVILLETFPVTRSGKIRKFMLKGE
jgi:acyl-CoA synthetase (AMP-forming)/AMP-acid ligase II